jgi:hypothetical protein
VVGFGVEVREGEVDDAFDLSILVALLDYARAVATRSSVERNFLKWFSVGMSRCGSLVRGLGVIPFRGKRASRNCLRIIIS